MKAAVNMFVMFVIAVLKVVLELEKNKFNVVHVVIVLDYVNYPVENNSVENAPNVAIDGAIEVQVVDNDIVNTETKRLAVINNLFTVVDGFEFVPCIVDYIGYPYLEVGDTVQVTRNDNTTFVTVITDVLISYNGGMKGQIRGQTLNKVQTTYRNYTTAEKRLRNAEINVDKVNGRITLEVSQKEDIFYRQDTQPFANTAKNGLFNGTTDWLGINAGLTANASILEVLATATGGYARMIPGTIIGNKYYVYGHVKSDTSLCRISFGSSQIFHTGDNTYQELSFIHTATSTVHEYRFIDGRSSAWTKMYLKNPMVVNLTLAFGSGNEPTKEQMDIYIKRLWLDTLTNTTKSFSGGGWLPSSQLNGAKYVFDGTNATFTNGGLIIKNALGETVFTADIGGNLEIIGKITATSGKIGRFDISGDDLVYTSDLFDREYDSSDYVKLSRILAGLDTPTAYESEVYDVNNTGTLTSTDLIIIRQYIELGTPLPTPRRQIRSVIRIGTTSGEIKTTAVSALGNTGSTFSMKADKLTGDFLSVKTIGAKGGQVDLLDVVNGVRFPATFVGSSEANVLDDYEEGTWTPTVVGITTAGVGTYTTQLGKYTKVGNKVSFVIKVVLTAHTGTGGMRINNLPFTCANDGMEVPCTITSLNLTYSGQLACWVVPNTTNLDLRSMATGGAGGVVAMDGTCTIYISGTYMV